LYVNSDGDSALDANEYDLNGDGIPDDSDGDKTPDYLDPINIIYLPFISKS
jgi:hypothetical protein